MSAEAATIAVLIYEFVMTVDFGGKIIKKFRNFRIAGTFIALKECKKPINNMAL